MSNLTKSTTNNSATFPTSRQLGTPTPDIQKGWAIFSQSPVRDLPKRDVFNAVLISVAKAFADTNTKAITPQERDYMVNELTDNIIACYPSIRISEIPQAISEGIRGKYGEYFGLSVVSFEKFISQYLLSETRTRAVKEMPVPTVEKVIPGRDEQFALAKSNVLMALERKKAGKPVSSMAASVYDFLDKLQLLHFTRDEKYDMMADAARLLINELKIKLLTAPAYQRPALKRDLGDYTTALTGGALTDGQKQQIVRMAKRLALDAFFQQVMLEEIDLGEMMDRKKGAF